jgi:hypothetical protein
MGHGLWPVYVPQHQVEGEVLHGLKDLLGLCAAPKDFTRNVNDELQRIWAAKTGFRVDSVQEIRAIEKTIVNIRGSVEDAARCELGKCPPQ